MDFSTLVAISPPSTLNAFKLFAGAYIRMVADTTPLHEYTLGRIGPSRLNHLVFWPTILRLHDEESVRRKVLSPKPRCVQILLTKLGFYHHRCYKIYSLTVSAYNTTLFRYY